MGDAGIEQERIVADELGGDNPDQEDTRVSQHPVDALIREIIRTRRPATDEEIRQVVDRMTDAPFNQRFVRVPLELRGLAYQGHTLGSREDVWFLHLVQRVLGDKQWPDGTDTQTYLHDLRRAVRHPAARLCVFERRGGNVAATLSPNTIPITRRGAGNRPFIFVIYAADRGRIVSGYQASGVEMIAIPDDVQWLK